jgi:hypothetical protein
MSAKSFAEPTVHISLDERPSAVGIVQSINERRDLGA